MMYRSFWKRFGDFVLSGLALMVLSPLLAVLAAAGTLAMKGNPFFVQPRPGRNEKIFRLIKFRTMSSVRDANGKLLPDEERLNRYGRFLRASSMDELPQLINILTGDMSFVGPRPLAVSYLPYYSSQEKHRHDVRPGLTGLAQVRGRNDLNWDEKLAFDLVYVNELSLKLDVQILFETAVRVFKREGIGQGDRRPQSLHVERAHLKAQSKGEAAISNAGEIQR